MYKKLLLLITFIMIVASCSQTSSQLTELSIPRNSTDSNSTQENIIEERFSLKDLKKFVREEYYNESSLWYYTQYSKRIANKTLPEFLMSIDDFVYVPPVESEGFKIGYVIKMPSGRYAEQNKHTKKHLLFGNFDPNPSDAEYGAALFTYIDQNVYDENTHFITPPAITADRLDFPMVTPIVPWLCPGTLYDQAVNVHLDRDSVMANLDNVNTYMKRYCGTSEIPLNLPFEEYEYPTFIDLEKQVYNIIKHSTKMLNDFGYKVEDKVMFSGFSNVGIFAQRFSTVYPEVVKAYYAGAVVFPIVPGDRYKGEALLYPVGTYEHKDFFETEFNLEKYNKIAKLNIVGKYEYKISYYDRFVKDLMNRLYINEPDFYWGDPKRENGISKYWNKVVETFYALGGEGLFVLNELTAHAMSEGDLEFSIDFLRMNAIDELPVYPKESLFKEHTIRFKDTILP